MKRLLLIGVNEKTHTTRRIINEICKFDLTFDFFRWNELLFKSASLWAGNKQINLSKYSAAFLDSPGYNLVSKKPPGSKRKIVASINLLNEFYLIASTLRDKGKFIANGEAITRHPYYNKFSQSYIFDLENIPSIETIHLSNNNPKKVQRTLAKFGFRYPLIVKKSSGGLGLGVFKIKNYKELEIFLRDKRGSNLIYQPYIENEGDFRILVLNGKSLGIIKRKARAGKWKNNFALGGLVEKYKDHKMELFAEKICRALKLDIAGIDIFKIKNKYLVIEVNLFPCFEGFEKVHPEINVAQRIVKFLISKGKNR